MHSFIDVEPKGRHMGSPVVGHLFTHVKAAIDPGRRHVVSWRRMFSKCLATSAFDGHCETRYAF